MILVPLELVNQVTSATAEVAFHKFKVSVDVAGNAESTVRVFKSEDIATTFLAEATQFILT
jgi:hypothetical protein